MDNVEFQARGATVVVVPGPAALAQNAAGRFVSVAHAAVRARGRMTVALSGGSTPRDLHAVLAAPEYVSRVDWSRLHVFWGDERAVPPDDPASNYRMAWETLLSRVPVPPENIHRMMGELDPQLAAREYGATLAEFFHPGDGQLPQFDLVLLGLGANGHTASLFPHTALLDDHTDWVAAGYIEEVKMNRITLTAPVINAADHVLFIVAGAEKAATVRAVLRGEYRPADLPAQLIHPVSGELVWLLDRSAASELQGKP